MAHGIHFDDAEVARLGETGTGVAHCPSSNCRLGSGICRTTDLVAGAPVGLGVDGVASNEIGGLLPELRMALFLARQRSLDPTVFGPADGRRWLATEGGARCLGRDDVGRLEPGLRADVVVWPGDDLGDVLDPLAGLVLGPERTARHVFVEGDDVVQDGALVGADIVALRTELTRRVRRLWPERALA